MESAPAPSTVLDAGSRLAAVTASATRRTKSSGMRLAAAAASWNSPPVYRPRNLLDD